MHKLNIVLFIALHVVKQRLEIQLESKFIWSFSILSPQYILSHGI